MVIREDLIIETTFVRRFTFDIGRDGVLQNISPKAFIRIFCFAGIEKLWEKVEEGYQSLRGKPPPQEVDPASLVGTFSRYKN